MFSFASVVSLLLFVVCCIFWVRSCFATDRLTWSHRGGWEWFHSGQGFVQFGGWFGLNLAEPTSAYGWKYQRDVPQRPFNFLLVMNWDPGDIAINHKWGAFEWHEKQEVRQSHRIILMVVPYWSLTLASGVSPMIWAAKRLRSHVVHRRHPGRCRACGYDLRATPAEGGPLMERCPECGALAPDFTPAQEKKQTRQMSG